MKIGQHLPKLWAIKYRVVFFMKHYVYTGNVRQRANQPRPSMTRCKRLLFISQFFHILARYFHETRGSLNFLTVHSCSQNLPLISCMYPYNFQRRLTLLCIISISGIKHFPALLAKNFQRQPPIFGTFSVDSLVIYNCAFYN